MKVVNDGAAPMSVARTQRVIREGLTPNYAQVKDLVVVGAGSSPCTFRARTIIDGTEHEVELLDFQSMYDSANFGSSNPDILASVIRFLQTQYPTLSRAQDHDLLPTAIEELRRFTGLPRFYMCSSGTRAVEVAIDLSFRHWCEARKRTLDGTDPAWNDTRIIAARGSLHGRSRTARALASEAATRTNFGPVMEIVEHVPFGDAEAVKDVYRRFGGNVVAVILEPVQGMTGCIVPPPEYLAEVASVARQHDSVFILDEIRTGFGRTGTDWAFQRFGVTPDLLCFGKSAGAGVVPLAGVGGRDDIMSGVVPGGMLFDTWSATPIQCAALVAAIRYLRDHNLAAGSAAKADRFFDELQRRFAKDIRAIRGLGFFRSMETRFPAEVLRTALLKEGMWTMGLKAIPNAIFLSPPLVITQEQLAQASEMLGRAFASL